MKWSVLRWVWQLEGPLYVGMPPAGPLNRTRIYVPARAIWGALTAELARHEAKVPGPLYERVGQSLQDDYRFTYLYPAEKSGEQWSAWLPEYLEGQGLAWKYGGVTLSDRALRRRLLSTRPGTAIDASTDAAEEGSLRETECIQTRWRDEGGGDAGPVAMVGYVFIRAAKAKQKYSPERRRLDVIKTLFLGGDTRYGLGCVRRVRFEESKAAEGPTVFGRTVTLDMEAPQIASNEVLAHAQAGPGQDAVTGALELLGGWDRGSIRKFGEGSLLWQPGSGEKGREPGSLKWTVEPGGTWKAQQ